MRIPILHKTNSNGDLHCNDGPAMISSNSSVYYYVNGKQHRVDGPATIDSQGNMFWMFYDQQHREDGPAAILNDGTVGYYLHDICYSKDEFIEAKKHRENVRKLLTSAWV